jgi:FPC/CPF motif-containing protein YcgG
MKQKHRIAVFVIAITVVAIGLVWNHTEYLSTTKHDTNRWAVIQDVDGSMIAIETTDEALWNQLVQLQKNGTEMWIGGVVERYDNKWGFHFNPDTIIIAQFTIEGAQTTIHFLSEDIEYWINFGFAYIGSKVIEIHQ